MLYLLLGSLTRKWDFTFIVEIAWEDLNMSRSSGFTLTARLLKINISYLIHLVFYKSQVLIRYKGVNKVTYPLSIWFFIIIVFRKIAINICFSCNTFEDVWNFDFFLLIHLYHLYIFSIYIQLFFLHDSS